MTELAEQIRANVRAIAESFGIPEPAIVLGPRQGQVNWTVFLGDALVLRLPRKPSTAARLAKEAVVIPLVSTWGVPTARVVRFDDSRTVANVPYIVLERLSGRAIDDFPESPGAAQPLLRSLAERLVVLHRICQASGGDLVGVEAADFSRDELFEELVRAGEIGAGQVPWLAGWFERLEDAGARGAASVLLHGDVMPSNLILDDSGRLRAMIDWGSARWGEPARELAGFRTSRIAEVVDAYRAAARARGDQQSGARPLGLEAGVLWYQLFFALSKLLGRTSTSEARNWSAPRMARLLELLHFVSDEPPPRWASLLPRRWSNPTG